MCIVRASLKRDLRLKYQQLSFLCCFCLHLCKSVSSSRKSQTPGGQRKICLLFRLVCIIFENTWKIGKRDLFIFIALGVTSFSFSNCTEELGVRLVLLYTV